MRAYSKPVPMTPRIHLFPFRTQKLSLVVPKILGWRRPGKIGRCRHFSFIKKASPRKSGTRTRERLTRPVGQAVKTAASHAANGSSILPRVTMVCTSSSVGRKTVMLYDQWLVRAHKWDLTVLSQKSRHALLAQLVDQLSLKEFVDPFTGSKNTKA